MGRDLIELRSGAWTASDPALTLLGTGLSSGRRGVLREGLGDTGGAEPAVVSPSGKLTWFL